MMKLEVALPNYHEKFVLACVLLENAVWGPAQSSDGLIPMQLARNV